MRPVAQRSAAFKSRSSGGCFDCRQPLPAPDVAPRAVWPGFRLRRNARHQYLVLSPVRAAVSSAQQRCEGSCGSTTCVASSASSHPHAPRTVTEAIARDVEFLTAELLPASAPAYSLVGGRGNGVATIACSSAVSGSAAWYSPGAWLQSYYSFGAPQKFAVAGILLLLSGALYVYSELPPHNLKVSVIKKSLKRKVSKTAEVLLNQPWVVLRTVRKLYKTLKQLGITQTLIKITTITGQQWQQHKPQRLISGVQTAAAAAGIFLALLAGVIESIRRALVGFLRKTSALCRRYCGYACLTIFAWLGGIIPLQRWYQEVKQLDPAEMVKNVNETITEGRTNVSNSVAEFREQAVEVLEGVVEGMQEETKKELDNSLMSTDNTGARMHPHDVEATADSSSEDAKDSSQKGFFLDVFVESDADEPPSRSAGNGNKLP